MRLFVLVAACVAASPAWALGDARRGQQAYEARCGGCHSVRADRIGPRHAGVVGRRAGSVPGFAYSEALRKSGITWDTALLERWLADPEALVPGQRMGYQLVDARARADIVAYLATLGNPQRRPHEADEGAVTNTSGPQAPAVPPVAR